MRCYNCGGEYKGHIGNLTLYDNRIGHYTVRNISYEKCEKCNRLLYPSSTVNVIEDVRDKIFDKLIRKESIGNFISSSDAAKILNMSSQALSKNRRISRGFIYWIKIGKAKLYHKKSVNLYKRNGDGRFKLCK